MYTFALTHRYRVEANLPYSIDAVRKAFDVEPGGDRQQWDGNIALFEFIERINEVSA